MLIHEIFISQKQELDLHRFVETKYTTEYEIYQGVKFIKLSIQLNIVKGRRCARSKANIRLYAGRKYALVPNKALSIGPLGGYYALLADTKVNQTLGPDTDNGRELCAGGRY